TRGACARRCTDPGIATRARASPGRGRRALQGALQGTEKGGEYAAAGDVSPGPASPRGGPGGLLALVLAGGLHELCISGGTRRGAGAASAKQHRAEGRCQPSMPPCREHGRPLGGWRGPPSQIFLLSARGVVLPPPLSSSILAPAQPATSCGPRPRLSIGSATAPWRDCPCASARSSPP